MCLFWSPNYTFCNCPSGRPQESILHIQKAAHFGQMWNLKIHFVVLYCCSILICNHKSADFKHISSFYPITVKHEALTNPSGLTCVVFVSAEYVNAQEIPTDMKSITDRAAQTLLWTELFRGQPICTHINNTITYNKTYFT